MPSPPTTHSKSSDRLKNRSLSSAKLGISGDAMGMPVPRLALCYLGLVRGPLSEVTAAAARRSHLRRKRIVARCLEQRVDKIFGRGFGRAGVGRIVETAQRLGLGRFHFDIPKVIGPACRDDGILVACAPPFDVDARVG